MRLVSKADIEAANVKIENLESHLEDMQKGQEATENNLAQLNNKTSAVKDKVSKKKEELELYEKEHSSLSSQLDAINSNLADKEKELKEALDSGASEDVVKSIKESIKILEQSREPVTDNLEEKEVGIKESQAEIHTYETELESMNKEAESLSTDLQLIKKQVKDTSAELEIASKNETLIRYQEERAERLEMIEDAFEERERMSSLLKDDHGDISSEKEDRESDRQVMRAELRDQLGIEGKDLIVKGILANLNEHGSDHELGMFPAGEALTLSRDSIFSANLNGITDRIKAACKKGATKIIVNEKEITGPIMYSLIEVGYNISHEKRYNPGRNESTQNVIIDWAFPYEGEV